MENARLSGAIVHNPSRSENFRLYFYDVIPERRRSRREGPYVGQKSERCGQDYNCAKTLYGIAPDHIRKVSHPAGAGFKMTSRRNKLLPSNARSRPSAAQFLARRLSSTNED
jgi:hypothetical protein